MVEKVKISVAINEAPPPAAVVHFRFVAAITAPILLVMSMVIGASGVALTTLGSTFASSQTAAGTIGKPQALKQTQDSLNAHIAHLKAVLRMTAAQERHWPPVEAALRGIAQNKMDDEVRDSSSNLRIGDHAKEFALNIAELRRFISAAQPLINSLDQEQKRDAFMFAQIMGFGGVAEKFK